MQYCYSGIRRDVRWKYGSSSTKYGGSSTVYDVKELSVR